MEICLNNTYGHVSILIPAYNEEKRIRRTIENHLDFFHDTEIFVTMDGCKDMTLNIVKDFSQNRFNINNNSVSYIHFDERLGKGMGLLRAIEHTKGDILVITDADESTSSSELFKLANSLDGYDCAIGSRWLPESKVLLKQPLQRRIASRVFNFLVRKMFGIPFKDTQCGAKVLRKDVLKDVFNDISTFNYAFDIDLLWQLHKKGHKVKEVPIVWNDKEGSTIKLFNTSITMFLAIVRLRIINSPFRYLIINNYITRIYKHINRENNEDSNF